jgi:hypothetical protein
MLNHLAILVDFDLAIGNDGTRDIGQDGPRPKPAQEQSGGKRSNE